MGEVKILAINDFHGQITAGKKVGVRPVGSAPVLASYFKAAMAGKEDQSFILHAGDHVGASPPQSALLQDEPSIQFLNLLANKYCSTGYRFHPRCNLVATVGNHEFDEGLEEMKRLIYGGNHEQGPFLENPYNGAAFPYVAANVVNAKWGIPVLPPLVIKRVNGVPIAFIGAVIRETPTMVTPSGVSTVKFLDEAEAINSYIPYLRLMGVRAVVAVIHQGGTQTGYDGSTDTWKTGPTGAILDIVARLHDEVDVVISGHAHGFTNAIVKNNNGKEILLTQAWSSGTAFADIDLEIDRCTKDVVAKSASVITTWADAGPGLTPDPDVAALVSEAEARVAPLVNRPIGIAATDIFRNQNTAGESALGNLIADAQRAAMGTDFAFMNPGGIRADLTAGEVLWGELYSVQPFNNYLVKLELTGQQIYELLAQQWKPHQTSYARFLQISGLTYTWDNGSDNDPQANNQVVEVRQDGVPIDKNATYTVTVNSFLADGGDLFDVLKAGTNRVVGPVDLEALVQYLQDLPQPFSAAIEGRIQSVN
jgi:5'-nucleotidase